MRSPPSPVDSRCFSPRESTPLSGLCHAIRGQRLALHQSAAGSWCASLQAHRRPVRSHRRLATCQRDAPASPLTQKSLSVGLSRHETTPKTGRATVYEIFRLDDRVNGDQFEQVDRRLVFGGSASHHWQNTWLGKAMDHTLGMQVRSDSIPTVALHKTRERERLSTVREDTVHETSLAWYYQNHTQWFEKVRTTLGLRGDVFFFDVDSTLAANAGDKANAIFSPKVTLTFGPWANTEVYLNGGFSFHSNDARGTTITRDPSTGERATRVDPLVRTKGAEVGVRSTWVPRLNTTLALWYLELESELNGIKIRVIHWNRYSYGNAYIAQPPTIGHVPCLTLRRDILRRSSLCPFRHADDCTTH